MQMAFHWSDLLEIFLSIFCFISGIRDFMGKDPLINLPFNQYNRDPEYRAFWQKKNGVLYIFNSGAFLITFFMPHNALNWLPAVVVIVDLIYLVAYESWEHSTDD